MKYNVTFSLSAVCDIEVEAKNKEEAIEKAEDEFYGLSFGKAEYVDADVACVSDEDGNTL